MKNELCTICGRFENGHLGSGHVYRDSSDGTETDGQVAARQARALTDIRYEIFQKRPDTHEALRVAQELLGTVISILEARARNVV